MQRTLLLSSLFVMAACGGGGGGGPGPAFQFDCTGGTNVILETDEQAFLDIGGAFDQLRHDEGNNPPIKMTTKIDNYVRTYMCQNKVPGLALGIVWQGNIVYMKGYGLARGYGTASLADDMPVRAQQTRFRWASVSKTVTGTASVIATKELDAGGQPLFDLDASLQGNYRCTNEICVFDLPTTWYPDWFTSIEDDDWPLDIEAIPGNQGNYDFTPRRLLANRCGVMHYGEGDPNGASGVPSEALKQANPGFVWAIDQWTGEPLVRLPGGIYNYSSFGFNMAGAALDWAVPGTYWSYVKSRIADVTQPSPMLFFHPDDVYDPQYAAAPWFTAQNRVHGYRKDEGGNVLVNTVPGDVSYKLPSGGFISTVADLTLYAHGLLHNHFLDPAATEELWTPQDNLVQGLPGGPATGYALGFSIGQQSGERVVAHSGKQQDGTSRLLLFPDGEDPSVGQLAIVVMSNAEFAGPGTVANAIEAFLRNPWSEASILVFEGRVPRNLAHAEEDAAQRLAYGPYVDDGFYLEPERDLYDVGNAAEFRVQAHRYNPDYAWAPRSESPERVPDDDDLEPDSARTPSTPPPVR